MNDITAPSDLHDSIGEKITLDYVDRPGLGGICWKNFFLGIITFGIYRFWAKTNVRKHIWSCIKINGEPLEYTGKGVELFLGAILIFFVIFLPLLLVIFGLQFAGMPEAAAIVQIGFTLIFFTLIGMAIYRARRYRLSRTLWRGIRGTLVGSSWQYSWRYFVAIIASMLSLGWSAPALNLKLHRRITTDMRFGETPFHFNENAKAPYPEFAKAWFGMLGVAVAAGLLVGLINLMPEAFDATYDFIADNAAFTILFFLIAIAAYFAFIALISFIWAFYIAAELIVFTKNTTFDNARFKLNATGWSLVRLFFGNLFITIFSLGIAAPMAAQRTVRYMVDRLEVDGTVNIGQIQQSSAEMSKTGEGLLDAFDIDGI